MKEWNGSGKALAGSAFRSGRMKSLSNRTVLHRLRLRRRRVRGRRLSPHEPAAAPVHGPESGRGRQGGHRPPMRRFRIGRIVGGVVVGLVATAVAIVVGIALATHGRFDLLTVVEVFFGTGWGLLWLAERFGVIQDAFRNVNEPESAGCLNLRQRSDGLPGVRAGARRLEGEQEARCPGCEREVAQEDKEDHGEWKRLTGIRHPVLDRDREARSHRPAGAAPRVPSPRRVVAATNAGGDSNRSRVQRAGRRAKGYPGGRGGAQVEGRLRRQDQSGYRRGQCGPSIGTKSRPSR